MVKKKEIQERQYSFPYHYVPREEERTFTQTMYWSWGFRYLGGIKVVLDLIAEEGFQSLLDVGCGDGRLLKEIQKKYSEKHLMGIDISQRAISMANAMTPEIEYRCIDISADAYIGKFDIVTAIETMEHIEVKELDNFLRAISERLTKRGKLILTVPHINKKLGDKHFQHFDAEKLRSVLFKDYVVEKILPFDRNSRIFEVLSKLIGGKGVYYVLTNERLNKYIFENYKNNILYETGA